MAREDIGKVREHSEDVNNQLNLPIMSGSPSSSLISGTHIGVPTFKY